MRVKIINESSIIMPSWFTGANRDPIELRSSDQPRKPTFKIMYEQDPKTKEFNTMNIVKGRKSVAKIKFNSVEDTYDAQNVILHHLGNPKDYYTPRWDPVITGDNMAKAIRKTANELKGKIITEAMTDEPIVIETVDSPSRFMRVTGIELDLKAIKKAIGIDRGFIMITDQDDQDQVSNLAQKLAKLPHNKNDVCAKATYKGKPVVIFDEEAGSEYGESGVATIFINPEDMPAILGTDNIEYVTSY